MAISDLIKKFGFKEHPFLHVNAEAERGLKEYFIEPANFSFILDGIKTSSAIVSGERGTGKTALSLELINKLNNNKENLVVHITDFENINEEYDQNDLYSLIVSKISEKFFLYCAKNNATLWGYNKNDRLQLSWYKYKYQQSITNNYLQEEILKIQHFFLKRWIFDIYNFFRGVLDYGFKSTMLIFSDVVSRHFVSLPPLDNEKSYLKKVNIPVDLDFINLKAKTSFSEIEKICKLITKKRIIKNIYIVFDKIDEDARFQNDVEKIAKFIKPMCNNNKILINDFNLYTLLFTWSAPFNYIKSEVRTQKIVFQTMAWNDELLKEVLETRIKLFSENKTGINELFDNPNRSLNLILSMCNKNPRDLFGIIKAIMDVQSEIYPEDKLSDVAVKKGINNFVRNFNYYEYYPRKSNARKDSMDIYRYFNHLKKLKDIFCNNFRFTKNQLTEYAKTGSSTPNYVTGMERINLIRATNEKSNGGILYEIIDPKITYAIKNDLDISEP